MEWPRFTGWIALLLTAMAWLAGANDDYLVTFPNVPSAGTILKDGYMLGHFHSDELTLGDITISSSLPPKHPGQLYFNDNMYFGDDRAYGYPQANDQNSIFLCRVDDNGDPIWGEAFTAEGGFNTRDEEGAKLSPKDLAVDENGNAYVLTNAHSSKIAFGTDLEHTFFGHWEDGLDIFVTKVSPEGTVLWVQRIGGAGQDTGVKIAVDDTDGKVWLYGHFKSDFMDFEYGKHFVSNVAWKNDISTAEIFLAALSTATGEVIFTQDFRGMGDDEARDIIIDSSRRVLYLTGHTKSSTLSFQGEDLWNRNNDFAVSFVAAFNMTSTLTIWAKMYGRGAIVGASYDPVSQSLFLRGDFPSLGPEDGSGGYPNFVRLDGRNGVIVWDQAFAPALGTHMPLYCHRCNGTILVGNHYDDGFYGSIVDDDSASDHTEQAPGFFYKLVLDGTSVVSSSSVYGTGSPHINEIYMDQHGLLYMVGQLSAGDLTINGHTVSVTNPGDSLFIGRFDMGATASKLPSSDPEPPTPAPTPAPTASPTRSPTNSPTRAPTRTPTQGGTRSPTRPPTRTPTRSPTRTPTRAPTTKARRRLMNVNQAPSADAAKPPAFVTQPSSSSMFLGFVACGVLLAGFLVAMVVRRGRAEAQQGNRSVVLPQH